MGGLLGIYGGKHYGSRRCLVGMTGLDGVGKHRILKLVSTSKIQESHITIGMPIVETSYQNIDIKSWQTGGFHMIRNIWVRKYDGLQGLIFVIDLADKERIDIAKQELDFALDVEKFKDIPLLIFVKRAEDSIDEITEINEKFKISEITERQWKIQPIKMNSGKEIIEGLEWLRSEILK